MQEGITINLSMRRDVLQCLFKHDIHPYSFEDPKLSLQKSKANTEFEETEIVFWHTNGLFLLYETSQRSNGDLLELEIIGQHIALIFSYNLSNKYTVSLTNISPCPLETITIKQGNNSTIQNFITCEIPNNRLIVICSPEFIHNILTYESWLKEHPLSQILDKSKLLEFSYFMELPIKKILDSFINNKLSESQKLNYVILKLREIFFLLHIQSDLANTTLVPLDIQEKIRMAKAYLLSNYMHAPTIKQLSRLTLLNEFKLKQYFKMIYGTTIRSYIIELRMEKAREMLLAQYSVNEVTIYLGYRNVSHFISIFKRTFGTTPNKISVMVAS